MKTHISPSKTTKSSPKLTDAERHKRFVETARAVEASESEQDFARAVDRVVGGPKPTPTKPAATR
jgi:hypothetical protein